MDKFIQIISSVVNSSFDWINLHPKTALAIAMFAVGFIVGTLF